MVLNEREPFIVGPKMADTSIQDVVTPVTEAVDAPLRERLAAGQPVGAYGASVVRTEQNGPPRVVFVG